MSDEKQAALTEQPEQQSLLRVFPPGLPLSVLDNSGAAIYGTQAGLGNMSVAPPPAPGTNGTGDRLLGPLTPRPQTKVVANPYWNQNLPVSLQSPASGTAAAPGIAPPTSAGTGTGRSVDGTGALLMAPNLGKEGVDWQDESLQLRERVDAMWRDMPGALKQGTMVPWMGGYRTEAEQRTLHEKYLAGGPLAAAPGSNAMHMQGRAVDWSFSNPEASKWMHDHAKDYGLAFPLANDPDHMQLAEGADQTKWDMPLLQKTAYELESSSGKNVQQPSGPDDGVGPMQITPGKFREYARPGEDINNWQNNIDVGNRILASYYKRYNGDMNKALLAYRMGQEWMDQNLNTPLNQMPERAQAYLDKAHRMWGGTTPGAPIGAPTDLSGNPGYQRIIEQQNREIAQREADYERLKAEFEKTDPNSPARRRLLDSMLDTEQQLRQRYLDKEANPPTQKPADFFQNFGSLATVIGVLGGMLSRRGMVASLDAAGAAMEAINNNNYEQWEQAYKIWNKQSDMLSKAAEMEHTAYRDVLEDEQLSLKDKWERYHGLAELYGNKEAIEALRTGNLEKAWQLPYDLQKANDAHEEVRAKIADTKAQEQERRNKAEQEAQIDKLADDYVKTLPADMPQDQKNLERFHYVNQLRGEAAEGAKPASAPTLLERRVAKRADDLDQAWAADPKNQAALAAAGGKVPSDVAWQHYLQARQEGQETTPAGMRAMNDPRVIAFRKFVEERGGNPTSEEMQRFMQQQHGIRSGLGAIMNRFFEENPNAKATEAMQFYAQTVGESAAARSFGGGAMGTSARAFNTSINHLAVFKQLGDALHNGNTNIINAAKNAVKTELGWAEVPAFDVVKGFVAEELTKGALGTAGGVTERMALAERIKNSSSPDQMAGFIEVAQHLMLGQLDSLRQSWVGWGVGDPQQFVDTFLTGRAKTALSTMEAGGGQLGPPFAPAGGGGQEGGVIKQNGWRYDAITHKPLGPVQQ